VKKRLLTVLIIFVSIIVVSCNSCDSKNETDTISDKDAIAQTDNDVEDDKDINQDIDTTSPDTNIIIDSDNEIPDSDTDTDSTCLDLKIQANVIKAGFPLKDKNGKITFCRPGCDTPTENDPQCVRNLWEWNNWGVYQTYLNDPENTSPECYPWPCVIDGMKAYRTMKSDCDRFLSVDNYSSSMGTIGDLRVSGGIAGIEMGGYVNGYNSSRAMAYHIEKDEYEPVGYSGAYTQFNHDRFIFVTANGDLSKENHTQMYIISAKRNDDGTWKHEAIYDDEQHMGDLSRPPFVGKDWVLIQVHHRVTGKYEVFYSKVDEWNWIKFEPPKVYEGNISGNRLSFIIGDREIYVCDLDKSPEKVSDCTKINRDGELGHGPRLDQLNPDRLVYNVYGEPKFVEVDLSVTPHKYTEHSITPSEEELMGFEPSDFRKGIVLYDEMFSVGQGWDHKSCFYNMEQKKSYCPDEGPWPNTLEYLMGFGTFDENYQLWKIPAGSACAVRDIKCWCEENNMGCESVFGK